MREFLRTCIAHDKVSHAYLFTGPIGSNKTTAAYAFAQAILCPHKRDPHHRCDGGSCETCRRVMRRKHPDVHFLTPEGAGGYLVEQIRDIVTDTSLAPIQAQKKVYILDRVDLLGIQAANAFLKTLEEPPSDVVLILLGRTPESVLPTIVSRCQVVPFRYIPTREAVGIIRQNSGASDELARMALESCNGSITQAVAFLSSNERLAFRARIVEILGFLKRADDWDIIGFASELVTQVKVPLDVVRAQQEQELAENADFLIRSALRQIEARNKRQLTAKTFESFRQCTSIVSSWLRDVMVLCVKADELVINTDSLPALHEAAESSSESRAVCALQAVSRCNNAISYNVSPETAIDALLFDVRDILYRQKAPVKGATIQRG